MSKIVVCPLSALEPTIETHNPRWMMSLSGPGKSPEKPKQIELGFLALEFNDIAAPRDELVPPNDNHVAQILNFGRQWDQQSPLLIHCWMGISRSTAATLLILAQHNVEQDMSKLAQQLRALSPMATPNPLMIALGDAQLDLQGRLIEAVTGIGRGADAYEGIPFTMEMGG